jgi:hypothetical protein
VRQLTRLLVYRRFVDDAFGFALTWNYWFNDAVSTAADLVALQLVLEYWTTNFPGWALSLIFWVVLIAVNIITVRAYGEVRVSTGTPCARVGEKEAERERVQDADRCCSSNIGSVCSKSLPLL